MKRNMKKILRSSSLFFIVTLLFGACTTTVFASGTAFIDTNANGILDGGEPSFSTIAAAVTAASPGNTIWASAGTYTESINDTKGVVLRTSGAAFIVGQVTLNASGSKIYGFDVTNPNGHFGILINGFGNTEASNNTVHHVGTGAVVTGTNYGIWFQDKDLVNADTIKIQNNTITNIGTITNGSNGGIGIGDSTGNSNITGVVVSGNTISNIMANTSGKGAYGIIINHAIQSSVSNMGSTAGAQVTGNTISVLNGRWAHGIGLEGNTPNAVVTGNTIRDLTSSSLPSNAVAVTFESNPGAGSVALHNNSFDTAHISLGVTNVTPAVTVDASSNYWATSTPGGTIFGSVTYSPWYTNAAMTILATTPDAEGNHTSTLATETAVTTSTSAGPVSVVIPAGVTVTGPSGWDGTIVSGAVTSTFTLTPDLGSTVAAVSAIEVGAGDIPLVLNQPAKLSFAGLAGKFVGWSQAGVFHPITALCDSATAPTLVVGADCKIDSNGDLVVWTKHFTTFVAYTQTSTPASTPAPVPGKINVVKVVVNDNGGTNIFSDFPLFVNGRPVVSGITNTFPAPASSYVVTETNTPNYTSVFSGDCDLLGHMGLNPGDNKFCIITNDDIGAPALVPPIPPLIDVVKVPSPLALPSGSGPVVYTYTLRNIGVVPVTDIALFDDTCGPVALVSGDTNTDAKLDVNETWVYTCHANLTKTTTNTVTATGWANGVSAVDFAIVTVVVGVPVIPPLIHVTKVPSPLALGTAGGTVTYTERVTNQGTVPLSNVRLVDNKCVPVSYIYGDTNTDAKLDITETWIYTCQSVLSKTTTNVVIAEGDANGLTAKDFAIATVVVAPGFPNTGTAPIARASGTGLTKAQAIAAFHRSLGIGANGLDVEVLQTALEQKGFLLMPKGIMKGYFGSLTSAAVAKYQASTDLPSVGVFGPLTRAKLIFSYNE